MPSIAERRRRKQESAMLGRARLELLAELDKLKDETCDKCRRPVSGAQYTCDCPAAKRIREIGQELSVLINERTEIEIAPKEVKEVDKENKAPEITEALVKEMKESGMTYAAIAKHFGISAPTLANRRQNWELERVRSNRQKGKLMDKPHKAKSVASETKAGSSAVHSIKAEYETKIKELKDTVRSRDGIIQEQESKITHLEAERDELVNCSGLSGNWQEEIRDERKLLAILLEREAVRIKKLVEVG